MLVLRLPDAVRMMALLRLTILSTTFLNLISPWEAHCLSSLPDG